MAKINDWTVISTTAEIYVSEKGDAFLIRDKSGDIATFRNASGNIVVKTERNVDVVINEAKKELTINRS